MIAEMQRYVIYHPWPFVVDLDGLRGHVPGDRGRAAALRLGRLLRLQADRPQPPAPAGAGLPADAGPRRQQQSRQPRFPDPPSAWTTTACCTGWPPQTMQGMETREVYAVNSGAEAVENMLKYLLSRHNAKRRSAAGRLARPAAPLSVLRPGVPRAHGVRPASDADAGPGRDPGLSRAGRVRQHQSAVPRRRQRRARGGERRPHPAEPGPDREHPVADGRGDRRHHRRADPGRGRPAGRPARLVPGPVPAGAQVRRRPGRGRGADVGGADGNPVRD